MIQQAFVMKLKPGALDEYVKRHDEIWPELTEEIKKCGISKIASFEDDPYVFLYSEVEDEGAWDRLWDSEIHVKWGAWFEPLMEFNKEGKVDAKFVRQVFRFGSSE
jgi:L-rhamnose mutarotase